MAIEIVDFPIKNGGSFHSYIKLPEGKVVLIWSQIGKSQLPQERFFVMIPLRERFINHLSPFGKLGVYQISGRSPSSNFVGKL